MNTQKAGAPKRFLNHPHSFQAFIISVLFYFFLILLVSAMAQSEALPFLVEWQEGQLSVTAERIPLSSILKEVSSQAGLEIRGLDGLNEPVTMRFSGFTLSEGLKKLLAQVNHVIVEKETSPHGETAPALVLIIRGQGAHKGIKSEKGLLSSDLQRFDPNIDPNTRFEKILQLSERNSENLNSILYEATKDSDPSIREFAYNNLYKRGDEKVVDMLMNDARSPDYDIRKTAIESLSELLGSKAIQTLKDATEDSNIEIRHMAFQSLSNIDSDEGLSVLRERLSHPDPEMRLMAMQAMASKGKKYAHEAAMLTLCDGDELVRSKAQGLLQELGERKEVEQGN